MARNMNILKKAISKSYLTFYKKNVGCDLHKQYEFNELKNIFLF
jgi:hypothetical protein